jgi:class 3 adenylate cyclase/pimeloyl-ACP methyl ester carboxylesterase
MRRLAAILAADIVGHGRMMERDEAGTVQRLQQIHHTIIEPLAARHDGRLFRTTGDGFLVEFQSAVAAVDCGLAIQTALTAEQSSGEDDMRLRIGIALGDVVIEGDDVLGEAVNIAARLEQMGKPGALLLTDAVHAQVHGKVNARFEDIGPTQLRNIDEPVRVWQAVPGRGNVEPVTGTHGQQVRFCKATDGVGLAYARVGSGPPLVKTANWLSHLEFDWTSPIFRPYFDELARQHEVIRYDQRGSGLSDRDVDDLSVDAMVSDLEAVVEAAGVARFPLYGISQGSAIAIAYAVRHPERVSRLVLLGGYATGWRQRADAAEIRRREAMMALTEAGWGSDNPAFHQHFASLYVPDGTPQEVAWWIELQRISTSPGNALRLMQAFGDIDVAHMLDEVRAPTLVLHAKGDAEAPFDAGRHLAESIPGARLVSLDSRNHIPLSHEPCWPMLVHELRAFLDAPERA